jgi:hypothetical protein
MRSVWPFLFVSISQEPSSERPSFEEAWLVEKTCLSLRAQSQ